MRTLAILSFLLPLHASASSSCLERTERSYLGCHSSCSSRAEGAIDCISGCVASYHFGIRACTEGSPVALPRQGGIMLLTRVSSDDGGCKQMRSDHDGRIRYLCMGDGEIYDTYGQCRTYCR